MPYWVFKVTNENSKPRLAYVGYRNSEIEARDLSDKFIEKVYIVWTDRLDLSEAKQKVKWEFSRDKGDVSIANTNIMRNVED